MRDNLSASFVLMAGAAFLGYWFYHLTGPQRAAVLAKGRAGGGVDMGGLAPYVPQQVTPIPGSGGDPYPSNAPGGSQGPAFGGAWGGKVRDRLQTPGSGF